jgi:hypothetical protein
MSQVLQLVRTEIRPQDLRSCEHRTVAKDGRIVCAKIARGDNEVSPDVCRTCPVSTVGCIHLRFSLRQTSPSPLIVRYNGRTEIWDDDPSLLCFERAACAARVMAIESTRLCATCTLRQSEQIPAETPAHPLQRTGSLGRVVPFAQPQVAAATG